MQWYNNPLFISLGTLVLSAIVTAISNKYPASSGIWQFVRSIVTGVKTTELQAIHTDCAPAPEKPKTIPTPGPLAAALFVALFLGGCSMSLESARHDGIANRAVATQPAVETSPAKVRPEQECAALDSLHVWTGYGIDLDLAVGAGAGVAAAATTANSSARDVALGIGVGTAVAAAALGYWHDRLGVSWTEQCAQ